MTAQANTALASEAPLADTAPVIRDSRPLRLITCGSVDDGKSTLIGRLLGDTKAVKEDQRPQEIIPRADKREDKQSCHRGPAKWHDDIHKCRQAATAIQSSRFLQILWNSEEELMQHEDAECSSGCRHDESKRRIEPAKCVQEKVNRH